MECYEGATMIKTYRGNIVDGGQDHIRVKTNKGDIGYKIVKFQGIGDEPGTTVMESTLKIYKRKQTTINNAVDFTDGDLLAVAYICDNQNRQLDINSAVFFDKDIFNQDIYITHEDTSGSEKCNYYLELEQVKLNDNQSTMATLQSLRRVAER